MPSIATKKNGATQGKKMRKRNSKKVAVNKKGVVYLGHLPEGFEENEIREYFNQFGGIKRVSLGRSIKNGNPKGYAHLQFYDEDVAKIAVDSMNNYIMFRKSLKAELVDEEKVHPGIFGGPNRHAKHRKEEKTSKALQQYNESKPTKEISNKRKALLESIGYELSSLKRKTEEPSSEDAPVKESKEEKVKITGSQKKDTKMATPADKLKSVQKDKTPTVAISTGKSPAPKQTEAQKTPKSAEKDGENQTPQSAEKDGENQTPKQMVAQVKTSVSKTPNTSETPNMKASAKKPELVKTKTPAADKPLKQQAAKSTGKKKAVSVSQSPPKEIIETTASSAGTDEFDTPPSEVATASKKKSTAKKVFPKTPVPSRVAPSDNAEEFLTPPQQISSTKKTQKTVGSSNKKSPKGEAKQKSVQMSDASPALQQRTQAKIEKKPATPQTEVITMEKTPKKKTPKISPRVTRSAMRKKPTK